jgi:hypothetical protein
MKECEKKHPRSISISSCSGGDSSDGGYDGRVIIMESCNCSMKKRRTTRKGTTGQQRQRRRHRIRIRTRASNRRSLHSSSIVLLALAFTSWMDDTGILFLEAQASCDILVSSNDGIDSSSSFDDDNNNSNNEEEEVQAQIQRKPYRSGTSSSSNNNNSRSAGGGRLKARLSRKVFHVTTAAELNTTPWTKKKKKKKKKNDDHNITSKYANNDDKKERIVPISQDDSSSFLSTTIQKLFPFLQRGFLLFALSSLAVLERNPSSSVSGILMSSSSSSSTTTTATATAAAAVGQSSFLFSFLPPFAATIMTKFRNNIKNLVVPHRLDWMKLYNLPTELLPSLSSALLIAWVPTLCFQGAWWELSFLMLSFTSSRDLRQYLITQIIPTMSSTIQKLLWSEFWKHIWEYLLRPFPYNMLVPTTSFKQQKHPQQSNNNNNELPFMTTSFQNIRLYLIDVWTKKVNKRIDTWTISSMKAVLQKNVQSSVTSIVEDSFTFTTNDDLTRMIEMEEEEEDSNNSNDNNDNNGNDSEISSLEESEVVAATATESESESEPPPLLPEEEITKEEEEEEVVLEEEEVVDNDAIDDSASSPTETMTTEQQQQGEEDDSNDD